MADLDWRTYRQDSHRHGGWGDDEARFWAKVVKGETPDDCWGWLGSTVAGYGTHRFDGHQGRAHRFSFILHNGPIPDGLNVLHTCDNPPCSNPLHLYAGTILDNARDAVERGRTAGRKHHDGWLSFIGAVLGYKVKLVDDPRVHQKNHFFTTPKGLVLCSDPTADPKIDESSLCKRVRSQWVEGGTEPARTAGSP